MRATRWAEMLQQVRDSTVPSTPTRRCGCGTILRKSNRETLCSACLSKDPKPTRKP